MQFRGLEQYVSRNADRLGLADFGCHALHKAKWNYGHCHWDRPSSRSTASSKALRCRRKFLRIFRSGFRDGTYLEWERNYKWEAHRQWQTQLDRSQFQSLLRNNEYAEIAARSVRIESRTNLLFSFEKMALR